MSINSNNPIAIDNPGDDETELQNTLNRYMGGYIDARRAGMRGGIDETAKFQDIMQQAASTRNAVYFPIPENGDYYIVGEAIVPDGVTLVGAAPPPREAYLLSHLAGYSSFCAPAGADSIMSFGDEVKLSKIVLFGADADTGNNGKTRDGFFAASDNASADIRRAWLDQCGFFMFRDAIGRSALNPIKTEYVRTADIINCIVGNSTRGINNLIDAQVKGGLVSACDVYGVNQETGANSTYFGGGFTCSDHTKVLSGALNACVGMRFSGAIDQMLNGIILDSNSGHGIQLSGGAGVQIMGGRIKRSGTGDMHQRDLYQDINASGFDNLSITGLRTQAAVPDSTTAYRRLPFNTFSGSNPSSGSSVTAPGGKSATVFSFYVSGATGSVVLTNVIGSFVTSDVLTFSNSSTAVATGADAPPNTVGSSISVNGTGSGRFVANNVEALSRGGTGNRIVISNAGSFGRGYRLIGNYDVTDI